MSKIVTLITNIKKTIPDEARRAVLDKLKDASCTVQISDSEFSPVFDNYPNISRLPSERIFDSSSLIIVMGGDGSMIEASRRSRGTDIPIIGINFGRVGFLAELEISEISLLDRALSGDYKTEERMMLDCEIIRGDDSIKLTYPCLNETVLSNGPVSRLLDFELYCDGKIVSHYDADGVIVSTPTGSSAYSLSAGGPIVNQTMECIIVTPICPHSFNLRPVVFTGDSVLEIRNPSCRENKMFITVDGRDNTEVVTSDIIRIKKSDMKTKLVRLKDGTFINTLHRKLGKIN